MPGSVAQLVRAPSLYLGGPWFEPRRIHQNIMIFIPFLTLFLAVFFAILGSRQENQLFKTFAVVLAISAIGASIVVYLAYSAL